jgi:hypothetical protein
VKRWNTFQLNYELLKGLKKKERSKNGIKLSRNHILRRTSLCKKKIESNKRIKSQRRIKMKRKILNLCPAFLYITCISNVEMIEDIKEHTKGIQIMTFYNSMIDCQVPHLIPFKSYKTK